MIVLPTAKRFSAMIHYGIGHQMKAITCKQFGSLDALTIEELPSPSLGVQQVRIAVVEAGVNFGDTLIITGQSQASRPGSFGPVLLTAFNEPAGAAAASSPRCLVYDLCGVDQRICDQLISPTSGPPANQ